jgi:acetyl-CoA carboxylase carboxyl transferase subunit alpha
MRDLVLDFERPVVELRKRIEALKQLDEGDGLAESIAQLEATAADLERQIFSDLTPWQRTLLSRHPRRPYTLDYIEGLFSDWVELQGDRAGHSDWALVTGFARFEGRPVCVIGHQKGRNTTENIQRNFGMPRPEGYRKALRVMEMANRFGRPILTFIDTPGAFPGLDAEERGQAEAIARNILEMTTFTVPIVVIVIGEGGSGGALAIGVGNRVLMLENSVYSVISPEGCAAILWRDRAEAPRAAEALRVTADACYSFGVVDEVIDEPTGGAHRHVEEAVQGLRAPIKKHLDALCALTPEALREHRYQRFRALGVLEDPNAPSQ